MYVHYTIYKYCIIQGKGSKRVLKMSSVLFVTLYTYTIYLFLCTQTPETKSPEHFLLNSPVGVHMLEVSIIYQGWGSVGGRGAAKNPILFLSIKDGL